MKTIGSYEAKAHLSRILRDIEEHGETYLIKRRGQTVGRLEPYGRGSAEKIGSVIDGLREVRKAWRGKRPGSLKALAADGRKR